MIEEITKKQGENGKPAYLTDGREIETFYDNTIDVVNVELDKIHSLFKAVMNAGGDEINYLIVDPNLIGIGMDMVENLRNKVENIEEYIAKNHGGIQVVVSNDFMLNVGADKGTLKRGEIIDLIFRPANKKAPETDLQAASS